METIKSKMRKKKDATLLERWTVKGLPKSEKKEKVKKRETEGRIYSESPF